MKALLVVASDKAFKLVSFYTRPLGFETIRYRVPIKAMDNVDEVDPDAVIISAEDFPRQWKIIVQFIRTERPKERTTIIILKGSNFKYEEAAKASHLGVNGIVSENLDDPEELDRLQAILGRYTPTEEARVARRVRPADWDRLEFVFSAPGSGSMVTGHVESISVSGLSFIPDRLEDLEGLKVGDVLPECSLRAGSTIISTGGRIARLGGTMALAFVDMEKADQNTLEWYLQERPLRERRSTKDEDITRSE